MACDVEAEELYKEYPSGVIAVRGISFKAGRGRTCLMGPNGSGKTTTLSMIAGALRPTKGIVRVCGYDVWGDGWLTARKLIGYAPQRMPFRDRLSGFDNLVWYGLLRGLGLIEARRRARRLAEELGLEGYLGRSVASYSGGMRRRLTIAAALMGEPEVLILDEPSSGLDPKGREELWRVIEVVLKDLTIIYSSHMAVEAEAHSDYVYIFHQGRIAASGTPQDLVKKHAPKPKVLIYVGEKVPPLEVEGLKPYVVGAGVYMYSVDNPKEAIKIIADSYLARGFAVERIEIRRPGLEEVFLSVTGRKLEV
ncbi:MAG: ABC transporter ATP-binding protein [Desulfurococcales archaeon]|nr:ABC transporter ATP-binding protein [Desulfurococcales archaeon]